MAIAHLIVFLAVAGCGAVGADDPPMANPAAPGGKAGDTLVELRSFWSFRPFVPSQTPVVMNPAWVQQSIDAGILNKLEASGLVPSPRADRRTLIRRATIDLLGVPPSPEDVHAFLNDESPDAYARLIERLIASPRYGERWGRFWLDLVRYCDVPESWAQTKADAWRYRDWVVQALNDDMPYDRFVMLQLAADQIADARVSDLAALGFLGLSPSYWKELKLAPEVIRAVVAEEWEERVDAVTSTLLGLTVACARCHDHKVEPITQRDYYALAGVFASIRQSPRPMLLGEDADRVTAAHRELDQIEADVKSWQDESRKLQAESKKNQDNPKAADALPDRTAETAAPETDDASTTKIRELEAKIAAAQARAAEVRETPHFQEPLIYAIEDASLSVVPDGPNRTKLEYRPGAAQDVALQMRGNPSTPGPVIPRGFLTVLSSGEPRVFTLGSGRLELGHAIFAEAAPLAARVIVNRVWQHHFGRGLVDTPSNLGTQGARPSHPTVLDDLAARFVQAGWSVKWLHREVMLSATYQQSSAEPPPPGLQGKSVPNPYRIDPENRLLWRMNRRRLEVECWRDSILAAAGTLDECLGGPARELGEASNVRRTLYGTIKRRELNDLLRLYDVPDSTGHCAGRIDTTTPLQQLFVLNSDFFGAQAAALASRVRADYAGDLHAQIRHAYELLFCRAPTERELSIAERFLDAGLPGMPTVERWQEYAEVLLASNELMFVD